MKLNQGIIGVLLGFLLLVTSSQVVGSRYDNLGLGLPCDNTGLMQIDLAGQNNVNANTTGTPLQLGSTTIAQIAGASVAGNQVTLPIGLYEIELQFSLVATGARQNLAIRINKDGTLYKEKWGSNYVRVASGHNEAGDSFTVGIDVTTTSTIDFELFRQAGAGTTTIDGTRSWLIITKIK